MRPTRAFPTAGGAAAVTAAASLTRSLRNLAAGLILVRGAFGTAGAEVHLVRKEGITRRQPRFSDLEAVVQASAGPSYEAEAEVGADGAVVSVSSGALPGTRVRRRGGKLLVALVAGLGLPPWLVAIAACVLSSVFVVGGFTLQKQGAQSPSSYPRLGEIVFSPKWLLGLALVVISVSCGDYVAYSLAPISLIAPLSGVTVVLNMVLAPKLLGERLQPWPDVPASFLIVAGSAMTTLSGLHEERQYTLEGLADLALRPAFLRVHVLLTSLVFACSLYAGLRSYRLEASAKLRPLNPSLAEVALPAFSAAAAGGVTSVFLKVEASLLQLRAPTSWCVICLVLAVCLAVVQMNFITRGLRLYMQTIFIPVYNSLLVLVNTVYGAVFFQEDLQLLSPGGCPFAFGVVLILNGICLFALRAPGVPEQSKLPKI